MATLPYPYRMPNFLNETSATYHSRRGVYLSSHQLADFRHSPRLYHDKLMGLIKDGDKPWFALGRAVHSLTLEGLDAFSSEFRLACRGSAKDGRTSLAAWQWKLAFAMAAAVHKHALASQLLDEGRAEGTLRGQYCGVRCQVRLDWFSCLHGIVDLKTCESLDEFAHSARSFEYAHQLAFYRSLVELSTGQTPRVWMIAVEKQGSHRVGVWRIGRQNLDACRKENETAIARLAYCVSTQDWLAQPDYDEVQEL